MTKIFDNYFEYAIFQLIAIVGAINLNEHCMKSNLDFKHCLQLIIIGLIALTIISLTSLNKTINSKEDMKTKTIKYIVDGMILLILGSMMQSYMYF